MVVYDMIAQGFGLLGTASYLISFQIRRNRLFFVFQCLGSVFFVLNFFMLGAYTGCLLNLINIVRAAVLAGEKKVHHPVVLWGIQLLYCLVTVFTFNGWVSIIALLPQIAMTFVMWKENGKHIRYVQLFFTSPCWLVHNLVVNSIGGVICEICTMTSTIISIFRFRRSGYDTEKKENNPS